MDPSCVEYGCYMFGPGTKEREACVRNCRLENMQRPSQLTPQEKDADLQNLVDELEKNTPQ